MELVKGGTGDELVTLEEFKKFYQSVNPNLNDDYLSNWFKKKDTDGKRLSSNLAISQWANVVVFKVLVGNFAGYSAVL